MEHKLEFQRSDPGREVLRIREKDGIPYLTFPILDGCDLVEHLYTTRLGGVSEGQFWSMNFSISLGDDPSNVMENYRRIAKVLGSSIEDVTGTVQTHTTNIRRVTRQDRGKVACVPADYGDVDGLVTNEKGIVLAAFTADCVPIYYVDPVRECIGLAHSGWRGTVADMAGKMVRRMQEEFGTDPKDLLAAIGPSICKKCYEVDETVAKAFREQLGEPAERYLEEGRAPGKYQLDLWTANKIFLERAGVPEERIQVTDLCTAENPGLLFSHRASHGKRGNMGAFLKLKDKGKGDVK
ncbi:MAG: peptidoglycan editing factor PgeF [Lachnospiraceae bacterium]|nr:peptidoglycan editing factor PgeF [Lachnospiraceae bacterium]